MNVLKFGGTSVGTPQRMKEVCKLIANGEQKIVVLSAMSGTTNSLVEISDYFKKRNFETGYALINKLRLKYQDHVKELFSTEAMAEKTALFLDDVFMQLHTFSNADFTESVENAILAQGEIMSTNMVTNYLEECGIKVKIVSALDYLKIDEDGEPYLANIKDFWEQYLEENKDTEIFITQGFICRNENGEIDNLQRGGSDYSACLIGAALKLNEIQIWTDIDGMHNNDPRFVENTQPVRQLHFEEAAELAYFGAKILHPTCILPARFTGVPVRLLNTMQPTQPGTIINNEMREGVIKAVAAKDNITVIKVVSSRMLLAKGYLRSIFEVFEKNNTSIDMVTTSEVGVSLSIDNTSHLFDIVEELKQLGTVVVDKEMCIICVVGDLRSSNVGFESKIANAMRNVPLRMISYGGSEHNVSFLIRQEDKQKALRDLSKELFS